MRVLRSAALGCAVALGAASAYAQSVSTRQIDIEPVETTVTQTPTGTVITRRPLAAAAVPTAPLAVETFGVAPAVVQGAPMQVRIPPNVIRSVTVHRPVEARVSERTTRVIHRIRETTGSGASTARRETRRVTHRVATRPLVLSPTQRTVVYRTIVQRQVVPAAPLAPAGYPPYPAPAYQPQPVVVAPSATTGYGYTTDLDDDDVDAAPPVAPYPRYTTARYAVGSVLPASVVVEPLPARAAVRVPAVQPYSYATVDGRVLLVDPVTNAVVADITP